MIPRPASRPVSSANPKPAAPPERNAPSSSITISAVTAIPSDEMPAKVRYDIPRFIVSLPTNPHRPQKATQASANMTHPAIILQRPSLRRQHQAGGQRQTDREFLPARQFLVQEGEAQRDGHRRIKRAQRDHQRRRAAFQSSEKRSLAQA